MNQEILFKKLGSILNELNEQYQFLAKNPEQLSELELELFHANADFLADHIQIIKKLNNEKPVLSLPEPTAIPSALPIITEENTVADTNDDLVFSNDNVSPVIVIDEEIEEEQEEVVVEEVEAEQEEVEEEPVIEDIQEPIKDEPIFKLDEESAPAFEFILGNHSEDEGFDYEAKSVDEMFDRPLSEEEQQILAQKQKLKERAQQPISITEEEDEIGPEPFLVKQQEEPAPIEQPIVEEDLALQEAPEPVAPQAEEFVEDTNYKPTLNDILASKNSASNFNTNANSAGIKDLKQAISLNDKLLYIKDLFNGYNLAYAEAIDLANKLPNFEAADNFFKKNYALKNNWADKQSTVDKFYKLLNERFRA